MRSERTYSISEASEILGVPKPTMRSWERRYDLTNPGRSGGGHRRYQHQDLIRLAAFRDMIAAGTPPDEAASAVPSPSPLVDDFLAAAERYDTLMIDRILDEALGSEGTEGAITSVIMPAMFQVGELWRASALDVGHEHLVTQTVRSWIGRRQRKTKRTTKTSILLAAAPGESHTIGIEALALLCTDRGAACKVLGANVPSESLVKAVNTLAPDALVLSAQLNINRSAAVACLRLTKDLTANHYAGRAFASSRSRHSVPGTYLTSDLVRAADILLNSAKESH